MIHRNSSLLAAFAVVAFGCAPEAQEDTPVQQSGPAANLAAPGVALTTEGETHFRNVRQLTAGGENAEAYWAYDGSKLLYQAKKPGMECDGIFVLDPHTAETSQVSNGEGRTTCSYFFPAGDRILFSSTHHHDASCPPEPDFSMGYVWPVYETYDVWVANADGSELSQLTTEMGYDAEATISPVGDRIVFTSTRNGDLDLYSMNLDGTDVVQLTDRLGYDGGAFYSPDGMKIVWRAHYPEEGSAEAEDYVRLLEQGLLRPGELEVYVMDADGSNVRQLTDVGGANFAPYWHPDGDKILWSSNHHDPNGRDFEIYMINLDGTGLERITFSDGFDGFPVFSPDGRYLVFGSNRNNGGTSDTNVFIAEWID